MNTTLTTKGNNFEFEFKEVNIPNERGHLEPIRNAVSTTKSAQPVRALQGVQVEENETEKIICTRKLYSNKRRNDGELQFPDSTKRFKNERQSSAAQNQDRIDGRLINHPATASVPSGSNTSALSSQGQQKSEHSVNTVPGAFSYDQKWKKLLQDMSHLKNPELRSLCPFQLVNKDCPQICKSKCMHVCAEFLRTSACRIEGCIEPHFRRACCQFTDHQKCLQDHMQVQYCYRPTLYVHTTDADLPDYLLMNTTVESFWKN